MICNMKDPKCDADLQILLIDHQEETSRNTAFLLRLAGYEVTIVAGPEEAINVLSVYFSQGGCPAVILLNNPGLASGLKELDLLTDHCRDSKVLVVDRTGQVARFGNVEQRIIAPHHILTEIRKVLLQPAASKDDSEYFFRFHAT